MTRRRKGLISGRKSSRSPYRSGVSSLPGRNISDDGNRPLPPAPSMPPGAVVGQWIALEPIGALQGCEIVHVRHRSSARIHATLKVAPSHAPEVRRELVREAEILFPLDHPNIVTVRNLMLDGEAPYLEMEHLRGERLDQMLARRSSVYMAEALDIAEQLLGVLVYLHQAHTYHRGLQPNAIMVGPDGLIRVMGFSHALESPAPEPSLPTGDPAYLPPEWPDSPRPGLADLYAVGATLYHLLTGSRPFGAPQTSCGLTIAAAIDAKQATPFLDPGPRFREDLRSLVRHLTRREPSGRLSDPADALRRIQQTERSYAAS